MDLSVVIPVFEEEQNVALVYEAVVKSMAATRLAYEIVFVEDGSRDRTFAKAEAIAAADRRVRVIKFRRNYGQTAAISAGIRAARGGIVVTMDGDLQNDPDDIPVLLDRIAEGYDIVVGWRHLRQDGQLRVGLSVIANWIISKVSGVPIRDIGCSMKAYRAELIRNIPLYSEMHRFIPIMTSMTGARLSQIKVRHHARQFGKSKYGFSRILKVMLDIISIRFLLSFVQHPMLWCAGPSLVATFVGASSIVLGALHAVLVGGSPSIVPSALGILFLAMGAILFGWGLVGYLIVVSSGGRQLFNLSNVSFNLVHRQAAIIETRDGQ